MKHFFEASSITSPKDFIKSSQPSCNSTKINLSCTTPVSNKNIKCIFFNAQSIANKLPTLKGILISKEYHLVLIAETWLKNTVDDLAIIHPDYTIIREDRPDRIGGGIAAIISKQLTYSKLKGNENYLGFDLFDSKHSYYIRFILVYRPPYFNKRDDSKLLSGIDELLLVPSPFIQASTIIIGDFNKGEINWNSPPNVPIIQWINGHDFVQKITAPTRGNKILDVMFTFNDTIFHNINVLDLLIGDHKPITFEAKFDVNQIKSSSKVYIFSKADYDKMNSTFDEIDWFRFLDEPNVDIMCSKLLAKIKEVMNLYIPTTVLKGKKLPEHIKNLMEYFKTTNSNKSNGIATRIYKKFQKWEKSFQTKSFLEAGIKGKRNMWDFMSKLVKPKSPQLPLFNDLNGLPLKNDQCKADGLANYFKSVFNAYESPSDDLFSDVSTGISKMVIHPKDVDEWLRYCKNKNINGPDGIPGLVLKCCKSSLSLPISILFNSMLTAVAIPCAISNAHISPIPKKNKPESVTHFRPIACSSDILKTFERIIKDLLMKHVNLHKLLPKEQHGFRSHMSTTQQLIKYQNFIIQSLSKKLTVDVILFDFEKAFDLVPISKLIESLHEIGIRNPLLKIMHLMLIQRSYVVKVGSKTSYYFKAGSGIPQGSVLGPILFIIFLSKLSKVLNRHNLIIHFLFADDLKLCVAYYLENFDPEILQKAINDIYIWASENQMRLSTPKTVHLQFGPPNSNAIYHINGQLINRVESTRDLGILVSNNISSSDHINKISSDALKRCYVILKNILISDEYILKQLFKTYIQPILEYGSPWFNGISASQKAINIIEKPLRVFTKNLFRRNGNLHTSFVDRLSQLGMKTLKYRPDIADILLAWTLLKYSPEEAGFIFAYTTSRFGGYYRINEPVTTKFSRMYFPSRICRLLNQKRIKLHEFVSTKQLKNHLLTIL